jgi:hypothetical protein
MNWRRRTAALAILIAAPITLASCGDGSGDLPGTIESAIDSRETATPDQPDSEPTSEPQQTAEPTAEPTPEPTPEPTEPDPVDTPEPTPSEPAEETDSGVPTWVWLLGLAAIGAIFAGIVAARRNGGKPDHNLAAQADGQLDWVRNQASDPLIRWRAGQLALPAAQRDTDSPEARTWALLDQRLTGASNDLLTLQSGSDDEAVRQAAGMLQQATDGYRNSLEALAASMATGDNARTNQAAQALQADTALFDQARQRFRQAARLV